MSDEEFKSEVLRLLHENNEMLSEALQILRKMQDPNYISEENLMDFFMNIVANIVASYLLENNKELVTAIRDRIFNNK